MLSEKKQMISIAMDKEVYQEVKERAQLMGISASNFINVAVGEKLMAYRMAQSTAIETLSKMLSNTSPLEVLDLLNNASGGKGADT